MFMEIYMHTKAYKFNIIFEIHLKLFEATTIKVSTRNATSQGD